MIPADKMPTPPKLTQSVPDLSMVEHLLSILVLVSLICLIIIIVKILLAPTEVATTEDEFKIRMNKLAYLDERGQVESLLEKANELLDEYDSQSLATYYKGRALYRLDRNEEAYTVFTMLCDLDPSWGDQYAEPYLKQLRKKMGLTDA